MPRRGQAVNQDQMLLVQSLGRLNEKYRAHCSQILLFCERIGESEAWAKTSHCYGKAPSNTLKVGWGRTSGNHQSGADSVRQDDGVSDMVPTYWLWRRKAQKRNNGLCQALCLGNSCPTALTLLPHSLVPPHASLVSFNLLPWCWSSKGVSLSKSVHGHIKRNCLGLLQFLSSTASILAGFYSQKLWRLIFPVLES